VVKDASGNTLGTVTDKKVKLPIKGTAAPAAQAQGVQAQAVQATAACDILSLILGPLHLDLLGLVIDLNAGRFPEARAYTWGLAASVGRQSSTEPSDDEPRRRRPRPRNELTGTGAAVDWAGPLPASSSKARSRIIDSMRRLLARSAERTRAAWNANSKEATDVRRDRQGTPRTGPPRAVDRCGPGHARLSGRAGIPRSRGLDLLITNLFAAVAMPRLPLKRALVAIRARGLGDFARASGAQSALAAETAARAGAVRRPGSVPAGRCARPDREPARAGDRGRVMGGNQRRPRLVLVGANSER
jgi:hypothetical protein